MAHDHRHDTESMGDNRLLLAIVGNVLLTVAQVIGGILSASLSLIADALHNLSDAASLVIAYVARKVGRKPPDEFKTFGYKRAENIAALINLVILVVVGFYLIFEAVLRLFRPAVIDGWIVVAVAGVALMVDLATAVMTYRLSRTSVNIRAAFVHNVSDALASVGVIASGTLILLNQWYWTDTVLTLLIAGYVLWQAFSMLPAIVHFLMQGVPEHLSVGQIIRRMEAVPHVENVHHVHLWYLDEHRYALEAHVAVDRCNLHAIERIKGEVKTILGDEFDVAHSTLEFEVAGQCPSPIPGGRG
jgi:cobalt-zinc-cadmium efflux system protein